MSTKRKKLKKKNATLVAIMNENEQCIAQLNENVDIIGNINKAFYAKIQTLQMRLAVHESSPKLTDKAYRELTNLREEKLSLTAELNHLKNKYAALQRQMDATVINVSSVENSRDGIIKNLRDANDELKKDLTYERQNVVKVKSHNKHLCNSLDSAVKEVEDLSNLNDSLNTTTTKQANEIAILNEENGNLKAEVNQGANLNQALNETITKQAKEIFTLRNTVGTVNYDNDVSLNELRLQLKTFEGNQGGYIRKINSLIEIREKNVETIKELKNENISLRSSLSIKDEAHLRYRKTISGLEQDILALKEENKSFVLELAKRDQKILQLENKLNDRSATIDNCNKTINNLKDEVSDLKAQVNNKEFAIKLKDSAIRGLEISNKVFHDKLINRDNEIIELKNKLDCKTGI